MAKLVDTIFHPDTNELSVGIWEDDNSFYFEENGDWYNKSWCENPLEDCKNDAMKMLKDKFNNPFSLDKGELGERMTFGAMQEGRCY